MPEIFSNTTLTVNQLIEKTDTGEKEVIIDGQQRLASLYAVMKEKKVVNSRSDEKAIVISHRPSQDKFEVGYSAAKKDPEWIYNISDLFTTNNTFRYIGDFIRRLHDYRASKGEELTDEEQCVIAERINAAVNLKSHTLPVFDIKSNADGLCPERDITSSLRNADWRGHQEGYPLHNCHFTAPEEILWRGAALFSQIVPGYGR